MSYNPYAPAPYRVFRDHRATPDAPDSLREVEDITRKARAELARVFPSTDFQIYAERAPTDPATLTVYAPPAVRRFLDQLFIAFDSGERTEDRDIAYAVAESKTQTNPCLVRYTLRHTPTQGERAALPESSQELARFYPAQYEPGQRWRPRTREAVESTRLWAQRTYAKRHYYE